MWLWLALKQNWSHVKIKIKSNFVTKKCSMRFKITTPMRYTDHLSVLVDIVPAVIFVSWITSSYENWRVEFNSATPTINGREKIQQNNWKSTENKVKLMSNRKADKFEMALPFNGVSTRRQVAMQHTTLKWKSNEKWEKGKRIIWKFRKITSTLYL